MQCDWPTQRGRRFMVRSFFFYLSCHSIAIARRRNARWMAARYVAVYSSDRIKSSATDNGIQSNEQKTQRIIDWNLIAWWFCFRFFCFRSLLASYIYSRTIIHLTSFLERCCLSFFPINYKASRSCSFHIFIRCTDECTRSSSGCQQFSSFKIVSQDMRKKGLYILISQTRVNIA